MSEDLASCTTAAVSAIINSSRNELLKLAKTSAIVVTRLEAAERELHWRMAQPHCRCKECFSRVQEMR